MQKLTDYPFALTPDMFEEALQRARAELHAQEAAAVAEETAASTDDRGADDWPERLLLGHELLLAVRDPIEWLLALARRLATGDPDDVAAIDRLTAALHARMGRGGGLGVRVTDVLTAFGILIGALDPAVVVESATEAVTGGFATLLAIDGSALVAQIARLANAAKTSARRACASRPRVGRRTRPAL